MESTPSPNGNTFYCPECKQSYPLSSKQYHDTICGGAKRNNNKKEPTNLNAAPCGKIEDSKKESNTQLKYPSWEEEEKKNNDDNFEDLQSVLEQNKQQEEEEKKKKEEEKKKEKEDEEDGVLSKIKKYGKKIAFVGAGIGLCALGTYIGSSPVIKFGMRAIAHTVTEDEPSNESHNNNVIAALLSDDNDDIFEGGAQRDNSHSRKNEEIIKLLPVSEIKDNEHKPKGNCTICLADFSVKDKVTTLPCLHIFHHQCIDVWLKDHKVCPLCKLELNNKNLGLE